MPGACSAASTPTRSPARLDRSGVSRGPLALGVAFARDRLTPRASASPDRSTTRAPRSRRSNPLRRPRVRLLPASGDRSPLQIGSVLDGRASCRSASRSRRAGSAASARRRGDWIGAAILRHVADAGVRRLPVRDRDRRGELARLPSDAAARVDGGSNPPRPRLLPMPASGDCCPVRDRDRSRARRARVVLQRVAIAASWRGCLQGPRRVLIGAAILRGRGFCRRPAICCPVRDRDRSRARRAGVVLQRVAIAASWGGGLQPTRCVLIGAAILRGRVS